MAYSFEHRSVTLPLTVIEPLRFSIRSIDRVSGNSDWIPLEQCGPGLNRPIVELTTPALL